MSTPRVSKYQESLWLYYCVHLCENYEKISMITEDQLMKAANRLRNAKALGLDGIPNIALFLQVQNTYQKDGVFLRVQTQQMLVLVVKMKKQQNKPTTHALSARWTVVKILERIMHNIGIEIIVEPVLTSNQYRFWKHRQINSGVPFCMRLPCC